MPDTATGADLDALATLVGVERHAPQIDWRNPAPAPRWTWLRIPPDAAEEAFFARQLRTDPPGVFPYEIVWQGPPEPFLTEVP